MSPEMEKMTGKAKQVGGKLTDNKKLEAKGKIQEVKANAKGSVDRARAKLKDKAG